ncbi:MAG: hypothetical protein ACXW27_09160 [Allosphingosinicella sp.]
MEGNDTPLAGYVWLALASFAGALTALSVRPFKNMTPMEIILSLSVSASFPIFVGPWAAKLYFEDGPVDFRMVGGMYWVMACGSNILIPLVVKKAAQFFGTAASDGRREDEEEGKL